MHHFGAHGKRAALGLRLEAVLDGVLDQRLQHHGREVCGAQAFRHVDPRLEALFHAHFQDLEVGPHHVKLAPEVGRLLAHRRHGGAQERDQVLLHLARARRIDLDQVIDARERVEEKMRLDLRLHRRHLRFGELTLEAFRVGDLLRFGGARLGFHAPGVGDLDRGGEQNEDERELRQVVSQPDMDFALVLAELGEGAHHIPADFFGERLRRHFAAEFASYLVDDLATDFVDERAGGGVALRPYPHPLLVDDDLARGLGTVRATPAPDLHAVLVDDHLRARLVALRPDAHAVLVHLDVDVAAARYAHRARGEVDAPQSRVLPGRVVAATRSVRLLDRVEQEVV